MVTRASPGRAMRGFSLAEIMAVVAIMGVVMAFGVPAVLDLLASQRMKTASFNLVASVMYARSEAVKRGIPIHVAAPTANNLSNGWCVMVSAAATCSVTAPGNETMRIQQPVEGVTYVFKSTPSPISFSRAGRLTSRVNIEIVDNRSGDLTRCVVVDVTGNARTKRGACS